MEEIKVSVIVPVYNAERFLRACLDSIQNQTLKEIEIICVDDGSVDGSLAILEEYRRFDSRFVILQKEHVNNSGGGAARNIGIEKAIGKYLAILDDDDFFELDMLETAYCAAEQAQAQVVIHGAYRWNYDNKTGREMRVQNTSFFPEAAVFSGLDIAEHLFQITKGAAWNALFLRHFIMIKDIRFPDKNAFSVDDMPFIYLALSQAERITILNKGNIHHRLNTGTNQSKKAFIVPLYKAFLKLKEVLEKEQLFEAYRCTFLNEVVPRMVSAVRAQQDLLHFQECYELLKGEISYNLELHSYLDLVPEKIYDQNAYYEYKKMMELSQEEYLFEKSRRTMLEGGYELPKELDSCGLNVILYGAGTYGKCVYGRIFEYNICQIVGWVDRNYEKIGFPVQSPDLFEKKKFDYIVIAIIDEQIVQQVKQMFMNKGIKEEMILTLKRVL